MRHLLVTNDFPPKMGGIQSYLWELWRRLPPDETTVLTTAFEGAATFDAAQPFRIERIPSRVMLPTPDLARRVDRLAAEIDAGLVLLDPAVPVGRLGPRLERPFGVVLHGAEVTIPASVPGARRSSRAFCAARASLSRPAAIPPTRRLVRQADRFPRLWFRRESTSNDSTPSTVRRDPVPGFDWASDRTFH